MFKILGIILIMCSTTVMGFLKALTFKNRVLELTEFQKGVEMFETEVKFVKSPLCEAFYKIGSNLSGAIADIFIDFSEKYKTPSGQSAKEIWDLSIDNNLIKLNLSKEDLRIIKDFGVCLGASDTDGQINNILSVLTRIAAQNKTAEVLCEKNSRLYQSLGIYSGILISVLLL